VDEARQAAHRRGSAAEAKEIDLVAGDVVFEYELVAVADILGDAHPKGHPHELPPAGAEARIVIHDLLGAAVQHHVEQLVDVGVVELSALLAGSIREYDDILWHWSVV
jgi:hypothetical protein